MTERLYKISLIVFYLTFCNIIMYSQQEYLSDNMIIKNGSDLKVGIFNEYSQVKLSDKGVYAMRIIADYTGSFGILGFQANINRGLRFEIIPEGNTFEVFDNISISNRADIKLHPNYFEIEKPFTAYTILPFYGFKFSLAGNILTRTQINEEFKLKIDKNSEYYVEFDRSEIRKFNIMVSGTLGYEWENGMEVFLGAANINLLSRGELNHPDFPVRPIIGLKGSVFHGKSSVVSNIKEVKLTHSQPFKIYWVSEYDPVSVNISFKENFDKYPYRSLGLLAEIPFLSNFTLSLGFKQVWGNIEKFSKTDFEEWRNTLGNILGDDLLGSLNHTTLSLGIGFTLGGEKIDIPIGLVNSNIIQKQIYSAKRELYAFNPIATLDIHNSGDKSIKCQISLETQDQSGSYRSESINIEQDEIKTVPLYLYLSDKSLEKPNRNVQMDIVLESGGKRKILSTIPITIFDKHSWDGNTWGLKYFVTPDEPTVLSNAKKKYIQSHFGDTLTNESAKKFKALGNFITELGKNIRYVQDPTSTIYVDRVQYPVETIYDQTGDCDDLSVYLASHLMAVGIHCVLVDIKPQQKDVEFPTAGQREIGHIFLLVDTGLETDQVESLGLKEFQFVSRKSVSGKMTIWIPIETTLIGEGFEKSFQEGTMQYYKEVIEKNGIMNGTVHVYDL